MRFEYHFERSHGLLVFLVCFAGLAGVGGWLRATPVALMGVLGASSAAMLYIWQKNCLKHLYYTRRLLVTRAKFGEQLSIECELTNDKFLPLPWVNVVDEVPQAVSFENDASEQNSSELRQLVQNFAMLPFQRTTRQMNFVCEKRGSHVFGSSTVTSGDPLGIQQRNETVATEQRLLVYPKVFSVLPPNLFSRTPLGDERSTRLAMEDPSRVAGMRMYRIGDPMRHIDWRASARSSQLLVRDFEPTTTLRVIAFIDVIGDEQSGSLDEENEFTIAIGASLVSCFAERHYTTGFYAPAVVNAEPVGYEPSSAPGALSEMLELLALCSPDRTTSLASVMVNQSRQIRRGTTVIVASSNYSSDLVSAIAECRRRAPVSAVVIDRAGAIFPPSGLVDGTYSVTCTSDWRHEDSVVFAT